VKTGGIYAGAKVLVTGGSGSIGSEIVRQLLREDVRVIRVLSRDETRQVALAERLAAGDRVRFLIGDVRDRERLRRAMDGVDLVFHAAAMKHVPVCEYNPFEAAQTNVIGTQNVITVARDAGAKRVVVVSTDKAVSPTNTMGATKLLAERLVTAAARFMAGMVLCAVRFGNVLGSRGSLVPVVRRQIRTDRCVRITDRAMTRFFMTIAQAVALALRAAERARGGELFVLPMPKLRIGDLVDVLREEEAEALGVDPAAIRVKEVGRRPGERVHERLLTGAECERARLRDGVVVVDPDGAARPEEAPAGLSEQTFRSETGPFLGHDEIRALLAQAAATDSRFQEKKAVPPQHDLPILRISQ
jgi:FlaA1/EpsC-like NDP-sugar epimerase